MAAVVDHPRARLAEFREITARPDLHPEAVVLDACENLMIYGDWMDCERGRALTRSIAERAVQEINRRAERARRRMLLITVISCAASIILLFLAALALTDAVGRLISSI